MNTRRFIVEIQDDSISELTALARVSDVVAGGRVSKSRDVNQHCFLTSWKDGICVACVLNKKSERFVVWRE